jgi:fido (protein-threonine AMPylation protein)
MTTDPTKATPSMHAQALDPQNDTADTAARLMSARLIDNAARQAVWRTLGPRPRREAPFVARSAATLETRLIGLALSRQRAGMTGRVDRARCLLALELRLNGQADGHGVDDTLPTHDVIDLLARRISSGRLVRVRGVARPLPDGAAGLGDPGSALTLRLRARTRSVFGRGQPLDIRGVWLANPGVFDVEEIVIAGRWPSVPLPERQHDATPNGVMAHAEAESSLVPAPGHITLAQRDPVGEALAVSHALAALDHANATSGVSLSTLCDVHRLLTPASRTDGGFLRGTAVVVRLHGQRHYRAPMAPVAHARTIRLLRQLRVWRRGGVHPTTAAAEAFVRLTAAHPFVDGNGRVARVLATWLLTSAGYRQTNVRDLTDYCRQHLVECYHLLHASPTAPLNWRQFFCDVVLATFTPPTDAERGRPSRG